MLIPTLLRNYYDGRLSKKTTDTPRIARIAIAHLTTHFRRKHVEDLKPADFEAYREKRDVATGTVRRELGVLVAAANWNARAGNISREAVPMLELPEASPPKDLWIRREQALRLLALAAQRAANTEQGWRVQLFIMLGLFTGQRPNVLRYLRWEQIDMARQVIDFRKKVDTGRKRYGRVKAMPELWPAIEEAYAKRGYRGDYWVLGNTCSLDGEFRRLVAAAGLPSSVTPNIMRHTWATWAMQDGVPLSQVAGVLGSSEAIVEKKYAHHHPEYQTRATNRRIFDQAISGPDADLF